MYQTRPDDYDAFRCIAGACPQTCCAAWEIVVDSDAQDAYLRLQHPLAEKLRRVMRVDADGDTYFAQTDGRTECSSFTEPTGQAGSPDVSFSFKTSPRTISRIWNLPAVW